MKRALLALVAGCFHPSPAADQPCSGSGACPSGQTCDTAQSPPVCIVGDGGVVAPGADATDASTDGAMPQVGCSADVQCPNGACHELTGECVDDATIIYVAPSGGGILGTCTRAEPCGTFAAAMAQVTATRDFIAVAPGNYSDTIQPTAAVIVSGPSTDPSKATVTFPVGNGQAHVVDISVAGIVTVEGLTLDGMNASGDVYRVDNSSAVTTAFRLHVTNSGGAGANVRGAATILACEVDNSSGTGVLMNQGTLVVQRSRIHDNGSTGIRAQSAFTIENDFVDDNDGIGLDLGGGPMGTSSSTVAFTTVANNGTTQTNAGVQCRDANLTTIDSSIFSGNGTSPQGSPQCNYTYSLFDDETPVLPPNITDTDPKFVNPATGDLHLLAGSPAIDAANPAATTTIDIDGDHRPHGSGFDIGADEH